MNLPSADVLRIVFIAPSFLGAISLKGWTTVQRELKKRLFISPLLKSGLLLAYAGILTSLIIWSIFPVIFFGLPVMLCAVCLLWKTVDRKIRVSYTFGTLRGKIVKIHIDSKSVKETKIGGVGFGKRRSDRDRRDITVCDIFIESAPKKIITVRFEDYSQRHCDYYREGDEVIRHTGARFPVILNRSPQEQICAVCGEFNASCKSCTRCKLPLAFDMR